ncbi:MAG: hypothetical protein WCK77_10980 [Verrucomicrobiota bacterium]
MPYQQQAARQLRRHVITYQDVCRANVQVTRELDNLGFWSDRLDKVNVCWVPASLVCYGWYQRHIYIPAITGAQLSDLIFGRHTRLTDVLRHEWAHAVADRHEGLMDTTRFERLFGGPYESSDQIWEYDPDRHLTEYAATMPCEDFAEVFHYYLRHKGRLPLRLATKPIIVRKWQFIKWLAKSIPAGL